MPSSLEQTFLYWWNVLAQDFPEPVAEFRFHKTRKWRLDYAFPDYLIGIELQGGVHSQGRHTRGAGYTADMVKYNAATLMGWKLLFFTSEMLTNDPEHCIEAVKSLLEAA